LDNSKRILVCPLDWGLGHASRCIPLIRQWLGQGHKIFIAAAGPSGDLLREEFPDISFINFPGYEISYPPHGLMALHLFVRLPKLFYRIKREHHALQAIIREHHIDIVVSDNRFGLHSGQAHCIYITHQVMIKCPDGLKFMEPLLYRLHRRFINKYDECWIPDTAGEGNISADLSHKYPIPPNAKFIGWLSRFGGAEMLTGNYEKKTRFDIVAVISGPEPQRSIFEEKLISALGNSGYTACLLRGTPGREYNSALPAHIKITDHAPVQKMQEMLDNAGYIICRPGYSSLMDLRILNKNAILVPTPGQTEQEYLATNLFEKGLFYSCRQREFNLEAAIEGIKKFPGFESDRHEQRKHTTVSTAL
jgi:UDP-N-acetylglucosamine transferase subunit ALG13